MGFSESYLPIIKADIPKIIHLYTIVLVVIYVSVKPILSVKMAALSGRETAHKARLNLQQWRDDLLQEVAQ